MSSNPRSLSRSFAGGEVTPEFFGRLDDVKYQTGLAICRNFVVKPHGPVENRAGFGLVRKAKNPTKRTRLLPFVFSSDQSVVIEIGEGYFRFHTDGATILYALPAAWATATAYAVGDLRTDAGTSYYSKEAHTSGATFAGDAAKWYALPATSEYEVPNSYLEADLFKIRFIQANDVVTLTCAGYPPAELRRYGATNWTFTPVAFTPKLDSPTGVTATATPATTSPGTKTLQSYVVTAVSGKDEGPSSALGRSIGAQPSAGAKITAATKANPILITCSCASGDVPANGEQVFISGVTGMSELNDKFFVVYNVTPVTQVMPDTAPDYGSYDNYDPGRGYYFGYGVNIP